jgi:hypothetical protein
MSSFSVWIGFDPREAAAFAVARESIKRRLSLQIPVHGLVLSDLRRRGLYTRPTETRVNSDGHRQLWDSISDAPMATEFAISRFLVPHLARSGLALFMDCDMLVRANLMELFRQIDPAYAVSCVKHDHRPAEGLKMDGQAQTSYGRKNWSSVMVFNCDHPANQELTVDLVNSARGRELHQFCWLNDDRIGEFGPEWNWLAGYSSPNIDPKIVHHTEGSPCMAGYEDAPFADEWRAELARWAA